MFSYPCFLSFSFHVILKIVFPQNGPCKQTPEQSSSADESPMALYFISNCSLHLSLNMLSQQNCSCSFVEVCLSSYFLLLK